MSHCSKRTDGDRIHISINIDMKEQVLDKLFDAIGSLAEQLKGYCTDDCCCDEEGGFPETPEDDYYPEDEEECHQGWSQCIDADPGDEICECDEYICNRTKHTRKRRTCCNCE